MESVKENPSTQIEIDKKKFQKMIFLYNALEQGWKIKKDADSYVFTKKHENRREIFQESYLETFLFSNTSTELFKKK
jgi:hypothetical protein